MTDKEIIALAIECGATEQLDWAEDETGNILFTKAELIAFAKAVQDMQREEDAKICDLQTDAEIATGKVYHNEMAWCMWCANAIRQNKSPESEIDQATRLR